MDLRKLDEPAKGGAAAASASVSMIHSVPDLRISMEVRNKHVVYSSKNVYEEF
jgi:hypothetical protein